MPYGSSLHSHLSLYSLTNLQYIQLLNALCGRAYYGTVKGNVKINGNESKIEDHKAVIGFVPQDDIVYPDLTVRENLLYSGRLQLPAGTTKKEIEELADSEYKSCLAVCFLKLSDYTLLIQ